MYKTPRFFTDCLAKQPNWVANVESEVGYLRIDLVPPQFIAFDDSQMDEIAVAGGETFAETINQYDEEKEVVVAAMNPKQTGIYWEVRALPEVA